MFSPLMVLGQLGVSIDKPSIRVSTARVATTNESDLDDYLKAINTIQYVDGLGRSMQTVGYRTSPNAQDMLMGTNTLDPIGRVKRTYLPVQGNSSNGSFQSNAITLAETFYGDTAPYSEVETYEASPFSRALKTVGAGQAFRNGVSKGSSEHIYTAGAGIRKYFVNEDANGNVTSVNGSATFSDGDLLMRELTDEANNSTKEFTDKEGRTIESWQIATNGTIYKTAYVYDDVSRLRYIITPKSYDLAATFNESTVPNSDYFKEGIYAFRYDERGRIVERHIPGGGWTYTVYNELDQALMSQNPRQRETNLWEWVCYDGHGRTALAGTWISAASRATLQGYFLNFLSNQQFEERSATSGNLYGYTLRSFPSQVNIVANDVKRVYYYDDYTWVNNVALNFVQYQTPRWGNAKGLGTGSMVRLPSGNFLKSVSYYDDKNRLIQSRTENRFGAINQSDLVLNFAGDLLEERTIYRKPSTADLVVATKYTYDHVGRKIGAVHYVNGKLTPLAQYNHDAIGRVIQKRLMQAGRDIIIENTPQPNGDQDIANRYVLLNSGTITATNGTYLACIAPNMLQEIDFSYNIRGQLRGINLDASGNISLTNGDIFGLKLDYHETGQFFDGKLHKQTWKTASQANNRGFTYGYDGFKRLQDAAYSGIGNENYSLSGMNYDANGNILTLQRNGLTGSNTWGPIDMLGYNYFTASNRLSYISEGALNTIGFKDTGGTADYTYYSDGSLKSDNNRGITLIEYNYLGLPEKIHFSATKRIENVYDAEGLKLSQKLVNGGTTITTDYMGDLIYKDGILQSILHDEGRIKVDNGTYRYQFFITDHLGNTRVIIERVNANTALVQENHYGAWGEILEGIGTPGDWNFLFQGKEWIDGVGYDFLSRSYDAWSGRFDQIDGANQFASGYIGMGNMPTMGIDPDGQWVHIVVGAAIGGVVNLGMKAWQGKIHSFKDGAVAFGIGAVAGGITAATGGATAVYASTGSFAGAFSATAVAASTTGIAGGAIAGAAGSATGGLVQGIGNAAYFGDPYSAKEWALGVGIGAVTGGIGGGIAAKVKGNNIINGTRDKSGVFPNFGKAKWVKTVNGWKLSSTSADKLSWQFPDWIDSNGKTHQGGTYSSQGGNTTITSPFTSENISGYYIFGNKGIINGNVFQRNIQALAGLEDNSSIIRLVKSFENEALKNGAGAIEINGLSIENFKLMNSSIANRLGYTYEQVSKNSIRLFKSLR
ncbi:MAG: DUF6443 domain-containing protein [Spirosomaceae bacterium]|nr:DUF6443 domain-containing protein [Spirosomataceae bacterium]